MGQSLSEVGDSNTVVRSSASAATGDGRRMGIHCFSNQPNHRSMSHRKLLLPTEDNATGFARVEPRIGAEFQANNLPNAKGWKKSIE